MIRNHLFRRPAKLAASLLAGALLAAASAATAAPWSHAMGKWQPNPAHDTCPQALHDNYAVVGPDGKLYPTWHPAKGIDPATGQECRFGHEHGMDPRGSALWPWLREHFAFDANGNGQIDPEELAVSGLPFGYVNEQTDPHDSQAKHGDARHEDHVGHKVLWANNVQRERSPLAGGSQRQPINLYCDMLMAVHQGTHSADAFTNNLHELKYLIDCNRGSLAARYPAKLAVSLLARFGTPGGFNEGSVAGGGSFVPVGPASPPNSPDGAPGTKRLLPTLNKVMQHVWVPAGQWSQYSLALYEDWISGNYVRTPSGRLLAYFDPHFAVFSPSRFFDPTRPDRVGRSIDVCYSGLSASGEIITDPARAHEVVRRARGGECEWTTDYHYGPQVPLNERIRFDDPRSSFNGCKREFYFNNNQIDNADGTTVWYTDVYGGNASPTPFPGAVKQYVAKAKTEDLGAPLESIAIGGDLDHCLGGVHAPN